MLCFLSSIYNVLVYELPQLPERIHLGTNLVFLNSPSESLQRSSNTIARRSHHPLIRMPQGFTWCVFSMEANNKPDLEQGIILLILANKA